MLLGLENRQMDEDDRWKETTDGQTGQQMDKGQSLLYSGSLHTCTFDFEFHSSNSQNQAIYMYLEILLVLQLNQVFYNGNMGESPRNEVLMIKTKYT